jgi:soluble lytic murein transglycosylase
MIFAALVVLAATPPVPALPADDPRPALVELVTRGALRPALDQIGRELAREPERARALGLELLRGDLLERLGRNHDAAEAYADALAGSGGVEPWARMRLASLQERLGHPEIAAGLVATLLAGSPPRSLGRPALELLHRSLEEGGDCRLLAGVRRERITSADRRIFDLARADCLLREGRLDDAARLLRDLLEDDSGDAAAWEAAARLAELPDASVPDVARLIGLAAYRHREFDSALQLLARGAAAPPHWFDSRARETAYAVARSLFWLGRYDEAAARFAALAAGPASPSGASADALCQLARSLELAGRPAEALAAFQSSRAEDPDGEWAGTALVGGVRLAVQLGDEESAWKLLRQLAARPGQATATARAALFLGVHDLLSGKPTRVAAALRLAEGTRETAREEIAYWRGRLAEAQGDATTAVERYLEVLVTRPFHPLATAARRRLRAPALREIARRRAIELIERGDLQSLRGAFELLGENDPDGRRARQLGLEILAGRRRDTDWVHWTPVPVSEWPLWQPSGRRPEEVLLALGLFDDAADEVGRSFPGSDPRLAFTGAAFLASRETGVHAGLGLVEGLFNDRPQEVPFEWVDPALRRLLYPFPWAGLIRVQSGAYRVDPTLMAAVIREESRFDPDAVSPAAARGLTQLTLPTARQLAGEIGLDRLTPSDLRRPDVAVALGAAHLARLGQRFPGAEEVVVAAYNAGEEQAALWRKSCLTAEPEEFLAKIGFRETKAYVVRVLESRALYQALYGHPTN